MDTQIARPIEVVRGYKVMSQRMGKPAEVIRDWASDGAPIYHDTVTPLQNLPSFGNGASGR